MIEIKFKYIFIAVFTLIVVSCSNSRNPEHDANSKLAEIAYLIQQNKLPEAKLQIDSFHVNFRNLITQRKQAVALNDTIILRESARTLAYCNANMPKMQTELQALKSKFDLVKNEKYEDVGKYVLKSQQNLILSSKTTLVCKVDEKGLLEMTSLYSGSKLNHKQVNIKSNSGMIQTTADQAVLHTFNDDSRIVEQLTFDESTTDSIAEFIRVNQNLAIVVELVGNKTVSYKLDKTQVNAIVTTTKLAMAIKQMRETENAQRIAMQRIGKINLLYQQ